MPCSPRPASSELEVGSEPDRTVEDLVGDMGLRWRDVLHALVALVKLTLPVRTKSGDNAHEHWRHRQQRAKKHRYGAAMLVRGWWLSRTSIPAKKHMLTSGMLVTLTRVAPCELDDDGNASGMKSIRDGVADALGLKTDRDPRVTWITTQRKGGVREYLVEIQIAPRPAPCPTCGSIPNPQPPVSQ